MNGSKIVYTMKTSGKLHLYQTYISIVAIKKNIKLSDNQIQILSYFMLEGFNEATRDKILEMKLLKNSSSLRNCISQLRKNGFIVKEGFKETLCKELQVVLGELNLLKIILDNR
jgi:hypothetical protein